MSSHEHRESAAGLVAVCAVLTVSDSRTEAEDRSGQAIVDALAGAGHRVAERALVRDEPGEIAARLRGWLAQGGTTVLTSVPSEAVEAAARRSVSVREVDLIVTTGGTGVAPRDGTVEVVESLLDRRLPGFGELFRVLSHREIGAAAMLSRATAGVAGTTAIFALPGSTAAVRLAMEELILPELRHLVGLLHG